MMKGVLLSVNATSIMAFSLTILETAMKTLVENYTMNGVRN